MSITSGVDHYTAAGSGRAVAKWVAGKSVYKGKVVSAARVCGHVLICRDGFIIQQVLFADRAYHAGTTPGRGDLWKGKDPPRNVNDFTVGIENSNYGALIKKQGSFYIPVKKKGGWIPGAKYPSRLPAPLSAEDQYGHTYWWEPYTDELVQANISVKKTLIELGLVTDRNNWVGHSDVSPERKMDPGPLWPMSYVLDEAYGPLSTSDSFVIDEKEDDDDDDSIEALVENQDPDLTGFYGNERDMCFMETK